MKVQVPSLICVLRIYESAQAVHSGCSVYSPGVHYELYARVKACVGAKPLECPLAVQFSLSFDFCCINFTIP